MNKKSIVFILLPLLILITFTINKNSDIVYATNHTTTGSLYVQTIPSGASIYLDSSLKGISPLTIDNVATGTHTVKAVLGGYKDAYAYPNVQAGQLTSLYLTLQQVPNGNIYVTTSPTAANIYLDNTLKGTSPILITNVSTGDHTVKATKINYLDTSQTVNVVVNQTTTVSLVLQPINQSTSVGSLSVTTNLASAEIYLDGSFKGLTQNGNLIINNIPIGIHTVTAKKSGYQDASSSINIQAGVTTSVSLTLTPLTYTCSDSDNGINYYVKGTATVTTSNGTVISSATDFCSDIKTLNEQYCSSTGTSISVQRFECNCKNGVCQAIVGGGKRVVLSTNWLLLLLLIIAAGLVIWRTKKKSVKLKKKNK